MPRLKYTVAQQIASMKSHGVSFALCDEDTAAEFLTSRTYFFKLKAFENNFERVGDRYTGLDFAYLKDLSTIDFHLRTLLSYCCLNIEHALKVRFNRLIMDDPAEDGYDVVHRFDPDGEFRFHGDYRHSRYHHSVYTEGLLRKYFDDPAVWNLWETVDFSTLCRLYQSYIDSRGMKDNSTNLFRSVRILRNAASHGNCLIIGIRKDIRPTRYVKNCLSELDRLTGSNTTPLYSSLRRYPLVHDFASVLCAFLILVDSPGIRSDVAKQLEEFSRRLCARYDYAGMKEAPMLAAVVGSLGVLCDVVSGYLITHADDYAGNRILHASPVHRKTEDRGQAGSGRSRLYALGDTGANCRVR